MPESKKIGPIGRCIYCHRLPDQIPDDPRYPKKLISEHTLPEGLGGKWELLDASCGDCALKTAYFEDRCLHTMFTAAREFLHSYGTRRKGGRPDAFPVVFGAHTASEETRSIPIDDYPFIFKMPLLPPPGFLAHKPRDRPFDEITAEIAVNFIEAPTAEPRAQRLSEADPLQRSVTVRTVIPFHCFYKLLAKIAHATAVSQYGLSFIPFLIDVILDERESVGDAPYFVGGAFYATGDRLEAMKLGIEPYTHVVRWSEEILAGYKLLFVRIQLFANYNGPIYDVMVGSFGRIDRTGSHRS